MNPLVSFVVPCYKLAHLMPQCVNSILRQSYENYEILIMDNCSPDNTPEVAASFGDPRVKLVRNETNLGHVRNFNKGITLATALAPLAGWEVCLDRVRLGRLLANLLVNAVRYTPTGNVTLSAAWRDKPEAKATLFCSEVT